MGRKYQGTIDGRIMARRHMRPWHMVNSDSSKAFEAVEKDITDCLDETLKIPNITNVTLNPRLPNGIGVATYEDAYHHTGRAGSPVGLFGATVEGKTKRDVSFALYFMEKYLWIEDVNYRIKKV